MKRIFILVLCLFNLLCCVSCSSNITSQEKCMQCGEKVERDSKFCPNCGATLDILNNESKENTKNNEYTTMIQKSKESIGPYLEYLPSGLNENGKIELDKELNKNKSNVYFCGMLGTVSYHLDKYGKAVTKMQWSSNDFYTYEEDKALADILTDYFGKPATVEYEQYGQYNDTNYYWTDESVPCTVILYTSVRANYEDKKDRIEIYWDMDKDIPN